MNQQQPKPPEPSPMEELKKMPPAMQGILIAVVIAVVALFFLPQWLAYIIIVAELIFALLIAYKKITGGTK